MFRIIRKKNNNFIKKKREMLIMKIRKHFNSKRLCYPWLLIWSKIHWMVFMYSTNWLLYSTNWLLYSANDFYMHLFHLYVHWFIFKEMSVLLSTNLGLTYLAIIDDFVRLQKTPGRDKGLRFEISTCFLIFCWLFSPITNNLMNTIIIII